MGETRGGGAKSAIPDTFSGVLGFVVVLSPPRIAPRAPISPRTPKFFQER